MDELDLGDDDLIPDDVIDDYVQQNQFGGGAASSSGGVAGAGRVQIGGSSSSAGAAGGSPSISPSGRAGEPHPKRVKVDLKDRTNVQDPEAINYKQWQRKVVPPEYLERSTLSFMQVDLDDYQAPANRHFVPEQMNPNAEAPVLRMYGITQEGYSVLAHIHGFLPYFYCPTGTATPQAFHQSLEQQIRNAQTGFGKGAHKNVLSVEVVSKMNVMEYSEDGLKPFFLVRLALQRLMQPARNSIETGFQMVSGGAYSGLGTYETNVPFVLRFMIDQKLQGGGWVELERGHYKLRGEGEKSGQAQIELDVFWTNARPLANEQDAMAIAPMRILSFDIECWNQHSKGFPKAEENPVIQIAAEVMEVGCRETRIQCVWTLDSCGDLSDTLVLSFEDEKEMLLSFARFFVAIDPDLVTGYNINNFDIPYLLTRATTLDAPEFLRIGRLFGIPARIREYTTPNGRTLRDIRCDGRVIFDMYTVISKEHNLRSYTLNFVSSHFLGDQKDDVHYSIIGTLHTGTAETRRRLAAYCLKDAKLPLRLMEKLCCVYNYIEMARVTGTPINFLLSRGQAIKVFGMILRKAKSVDYIVPAKKVEASDDKFDGATVLTPKTDYYQVPIATLDFASLYPSIMMAHNLCYCTLVPKRRIRGDKVEGLPDSEYTRTPCGNFFVAPSTRKGLLPQILEELLGARKKAKKEMNAEQDPFKKAVLNGRQLALKVSANSVYGFTGATVGMMPCLEISSSVTAFGRTMIEATKAEVERIYTKANGYKYDADVIYGDTDSVMIKFGPDNVKDCMDLGLEAADKISNQLFKKPIKLEFEKVYFPYLLLNKKRYAGLYWSRPDQYDKLETKGIETVRRDNCGLVQKLIDTTLRTILIDRSLPNAVKFIQDMVSDLLQNKIDMSLLIISKSLGKGENRTDYAARQAHVELAERMRKRNPATAPGSGDRVPYVIVKSMKKTQNYDKSEDPMYVLENGLSIDAQWYIDHQLSAPLLRIFGPIMKNAGDKLFKGDHTRKIVATSGGGTFAQAMGGLVPKTTTRTCLGCRMTLTPGQNTVEGLGGLCQHCLKSKGPEIYEQKLKMARTKQTEYARLWSECQRCQDSLHQEVICANCDCPIFYMRQKAKIDLQKAEKQLQSLNLDW